ncbi:hypothetical protein MVEG_10344 [Podila verticillata NRRL 6337]|nr:hypothetical protein MVEG_10344 [Podila verticillata NRRL 6337]
MSLGHRLSVIFLVLHILLVSSRYIQLAYAKPSFTPVSTGGSASVCVEGKAFYIQAGISNQSMTRQVFKISLDTSWVASNPPYTKMPDGILDNHFPNALMNDGVNWLAVTNGSFVTYNIFTGELTQKPPIANYSSLLGLRATLDPNTNNVIIPNGFRAYPPMTATTMIFFPWNQAVASNLQPIFSDLVRYSITWSQSAKTVFLFGGRNPARLSSSLYRLNMTDSSWIPINTYGGPSARESACMVAMNNGSKLAVFGGLADFDVTQSDIFFFDVANSTWQKGPAGGDARARTAHACAASGDAVIIWGGYTNIATRSAPTAVTTIFNMTANAWTDEFIVPGVALPDPSPNSDAGSGSDSGPSSRSRLGGGAIAGIVVSAVAMPIILYLGKKWYYRQRKSDSLLGEQLQERPHQGQEEPPNQGSHEPQVQRGQRENGPAESAYKVEATNGQTEALQPVRQPHAPPQLIVSTSANPQALGAAATAAGSSFHPASGHPQSSVAQRNAANPQDGRASRPAPDKSPRSQLLECFAERNALNQV